MCERLLKLKIEELTKIRLVCKNPKCRAAIEMDVSEMDRYFDSHRCPMCKQDNEFKGLQNPDFLPFAKLREALAYFHNIRDKVDVEFVIPLDTHTSSN